MWHLFLPELSVALLMNRIIQYDQEALLKTPQETITNSQIQSLSRSVTEDFADINSQPITKTFAGAITKSYFFYFFFRLKYIRELLVAEVLSFFVVVVLYGNSQEL